MDPFEDSTLDTQFSPASLSPAERQQATQIAEATAALLLKGMFHRVQPGQYRINDNHDSPEYRIAAAIGAIPSHRFARMRPRIEALRTNPAKTAEYLGSMSNLDIRSPGLDALLQQVSPHLIVNMHQAPIPDALHLAPHFNRLTLVLRKLCCVDETNPEGGDDDMILGAIRVGASGNVAVVNAMVAGHFDDNECTNFGMLPLGQYSLSTTNGFPKLFYCIFILVESDSDDQEVADTLTQALTIVANAAATFTGGWGAIVAALIQVLDLVLSAFFDDDHFPPYGIQLKLSNPNVFGPSGSGPNQHTDNIAAHGGKYRIGYRWELSA